MSQTKPSVCILTTSYPRESDFSNLNGAQVVRGKFVHDMAKGLLRRGFRVFVVTNHEPGERAASQIEGIEVHRFHYFFPGLETLTAGAGIPENIRKLRNQIQVPFYFTSMLLTAFRLIRRFKIDLINAHWLFPNGFLGVLLKFFTGRPVVITAYGAELFPVQQGRLGWTRRFLTFAATRADVVAGISQATVDAVRSLTGRTDVALIPDGIDIAYYSPGSADPEVLRKYGVYGKRFIFFSGRMVARKGHRFVMEAMRWLSESDQDVVLLLGGRGPLYDEIARKRSEWHLEDRVSLPGFVPESELVILLRSCCVFVLPSCIDEKGDTEGSATAAFEAMACGTPAVLSYVGGNVGAIVDGMGAYYFRVADAKDLAAKLCRVLSFQGSQLVEFKNQARAHVISHYRWEVIVDRYLQEIETHCDSHLLSLAAAA